ncbi:MAG TPA: hypothetical protein VGG12_01810 [Methylovirgula sp.]
MKPLAKVSFAAIAAAFFLMTPSLRLAADPTADETKGCICMELYQPVCGKLPNGEKKTFSNACFAKCAKAKVLHEGPC